MDEVKTTNNLETVNKLQDNKDTTIMGSETLNLWTSLPPELLIIIFEYLPPRDLKEMRLVCKYWRGVTYFKKFLNKFKLNIKENNVNLICEYLKIDEEFSRTMAYKTLQLQNVKRSENLYQVLKCLGSNVQSLSMCNAEIVPTLNEYFPELVELNIIKNSYPLNGDIATFDLRKFKNFKSLVMNNWVIPLYIKSNLFTNMLNDPPLKMENLRFSLDDTDDEELIIRVLQYLASSLKYFQLHFRSNPAFFSQWKQVFSSFKKLEYIKVAGESSYDLLSNIIECLPKELHLRKCDLFHGMHFDDHLLKLFIEKWSGSLECMNLSFCSEITNEGIQHLGKLKHTLKMLCVSNCKRVSANKLLQVLVEHQFTKLEYIRLHGESSIEAIDVWVEHLPKLRWLLLEGFRKCVDNYTLQSICKYQLKLEVLKLSGCVGITDNGLIGFGSSPAAISNLKHLKSLDLTGCRKISDYALIEAFKFNDLRSLYLGFSRHISSKGIKEMVKNCPALDDLTITFCSSIDDESILLILQGLKRLRYLHVSNCSKVTTKSLDYIIENCNYVKKIVLLGIRSLMQEGFELKLSQIRQLGIRIDVTLGHFRN